MSSVKFNLLLLLVCVSFTINSMMIVQLTVVTISVKNFPLMGPGVWISASFQLLLL